jgi:CRISPR/Cas system endoribonuclease Cas6 (RAMP superfamily)
LNFCCSFNNAIPSNQLSNVPWRRLGIMYRNNEAYFDVIEEIDAIIDRNGVTVMSEIQGYVSSNNRDFINSFLIIIHKDTKNNLLVK